MLLHEFFIKESVGFPNRKAGDGFINPKDPNDKAEFVELLLYPDGALAFEDPAQRDEFMSNFDSQVTGKVYYINKPNSSMLGLYIVHMLTDAGDEYYVRYVKNITNPAGVLTAIPANLKSAGHGGYSYGSDTAQKERYSIKPSNVFTTDAPLSPEQIPAAIAKVPDGIPQDLQKQMVDYLTALAAGNKEFVIEGGEKYRGAHENYTGEFAAPIAIIRGQVDNMDVQNRAEETLLGGQKFADCKIVFPMGVSTLLVDSFVEAPNGRRVGVSSKAKTGSGAAASLEGLYKTIQDQKDNPAFQDTLKNYPQVINFINTVVENSAIDGYLMILRQQELINQQEDQLLRDMIGNTKQGRGLANTFEMLTPDLQKVVASYGADTDNPRYNIVYHVTAGLARQLGEKLGEMPITEAVKDILNYSTMVQIYAGTSKAGDNIKINSFKMVWPPEYDGVVKVDTAKNFTGTEIRGKISFKMPAAKK
jgi:hypothetical protein